MIIYFVDGHNADSLFIDAINGMITNSILNIEHVAIININTDQMMNTEIKILHHVIYSKIIKLIHIHVLKKIFIY